MANVTDGTAEFKAVDARAAAIFDLIYPVGSIFATTGNAPTLGTWEEIAQGRTLQGADGNHAAGSTIEAGLPNIEGKVGWAFMSKYGETTGAFTRTLEHQSNAEPNNNVDAWNDWYNTRFDASKSNPIYGNASTVQPPAYVVHFYRRIA